ncbi:prepilin type IV pili [Burkholderia metallica]|uniref:type 4 pilus major pilin n=1 Tax=Burkholderia metallica TaxID=488729 RepID=UPI00157B0D51|nr:type 4 pilus major pilin [Burkholderia metallica]NTZ86156.1 prepilin type IV pili [Burkholderia metallica]
MREFFGSIYGQIITVLGLIAIVALGANALSTNRAMSQATDIGVLVANARQRLGATQNGYLNFTTANAAALIRDGIVPSTMVRGGAMTNQWGGSVDLTNQNNGALGVITLNGVSSKDCSKLVTTLGNYDAVTVGGTTFSQDNPADATNASTACNGQTSVSITFSN